MGVLDESARESSPAPSRLLCLRKLVLLARYACAVFSSVYSVCAEADFSDLHLALA